MGQFSVCSVIRKGLLFLLTPMIKIKKHNDMDIKMSYPDDIVWEAKEMEHS